MGGWVDGWMDGWIDRWIDIYLIIALSNLGNDFQLKFNM